jgi:hypothetical protein
MNRFVGRLAAGAVAGLVGTGKMSIVMGLAKAAGLLGEPPPQKLTRRMLDIFGARRPQPGTLALATALSHLGYGAALGALFGLVPRRASNAATGAVFGAAVWAVSYAGWVPKVGLMRRPSRDRFGRPTSMLLAHLVYGATLGVMRKRLAWDESTTIGPP